MRFYKNILIKLNNSSFTVKIDKHNIIIESPNNKKWLKDKNLESILLHYKNKNSLISYKIINEEGN